MSELSYSYSEMLNEIDGGGSAFNSSKMRLSNTGASHVKQNGLNNNVTLTNNLNATQNNTIQEEENEGNKSSSMSSQF